MSLMQRSLAALLMTAILAAASATTAAAQRATPVAVTAAPVRGDTLPTVADDARQHPRASVIAPLAFVFGVAGGFAGYYAAEDRCARTQGECWDHYAYVPLGYVAGVALGGGIGGSSEGCRSAILRSAGGAVLGLVAGAVVSAALGLAVGSAAGNVGLLAVPAGPVLGATWLVGSCRTSPGAVDPPHDGRGQRLEFSQNTFR